MTGNTAFEAVIGLEVHAQLRTESKLFSTASAAFGAAANTHVTAVCLGLPGALPVLNREAVRLAMIAGLATGCRIAQRSIFARKSYFYPDLPKGYQISQFAEPLCLGGHLDIPGAEPLRAHIIRIHMEEDAGKSIHGLGTGRSSHIDLNRAGVPLIEIVSAPDLRTAEQAAEYVRELRAILRYVGACDGNMEQGSLRCDANVSIRPVGTTALGTRCEIKNLNSFRGIRDAVTYEIERQTRLVLSGGTVMQQTRLWDADRGRTEAMRGKEEAHDYRYFPDPDLLPLVVTSKQIEALRAELPDLPSARRNRLESRGVPADLAATLCEERARVDAFEPLLTGHRPDESCASLASFVLSRCCGAMNQSERTWDDLQEAMAELADLHDAWRAGELSNKMVSDILANSFATNTPLPESVRTERAAAGTAVSDTDTLRPAIEAVLAAYPEQVAEYRAGKHQLRGFFIGRVMRDLRGKADAAAVGDLLQELLKA